MPLTDEPTNQTGRAYPRLSADQRRKVLKNFQQYVKEGLLSPRRPKVVSIASRRRQAQEDRRANTAED